MPLKEFDDKRSGWRFNWPERKLRMRSLYTSDPNEARRRAELLRKGMSMTEFRRQFESVKRQDSTDRMDKYRVTSTPSNGVADTGTTIDPTLADVLERVADIRLGDTSTDDSGGAANPDASTSSNAEEIDPEDDDTPEGEETPEVEQPKTRRKYGKLGRDLAHTMANINIGLDGLLAKAFGSNKKYILRPKTPPDEILGVMYEGYEMQTNEWLVEHPPRPWMLILAANIGCIIFMAVNGERVERSSANAETVPPAAPVPPSGV